MIRLRQADLSLKMRIALVSAITFLLQYSVSASEMSITAKREGTQVVFRSGESEVLRYQAEPGEFPRPDIKKEFKRGGYLHPVYTPSGRLVTDDFPPNHVHHHGIWFPWTKTEFEGRKPDFWNMGQGTGRVEFVALDNVWEKDGKAGLTARHQFVDLIARPSKAALNEVWEVVVSRSSREAGLPTYLIDLVSTQICASASPLILPKYHYGGFGFRGNWAWNGPTSCRLLTSEGVTDRKKANETRGKWCWIGGEVDGETAGVAILCHPENFRFPQPMRIHPTEPFFCFAPQQVGEMEIRPGVPYVSRYRIITADSEPTREQIDRWWKEWVNGK